jgi:hypothetical protein
MLNTGTILSFEGNVLLYVDGYSTITGLSKASRARASAPKEYTLDSFLPVHVSSLPWLSPVCNW